MSEAQQTATPPPNYLVQSILVTIFCCWPFGIPAIVYSAKVNGLAGAGDLAGAREASGKAKMWGWISFGIGASVIVLYLIFAVIAIIANGNF